MGHEFNLLRTILCPLVLQTMFPDLLLQLVGFFIFREAPAAFLEHNKRFDDRPAVSVLRCYNSGFADCWVSLENGFDLDGACVSIK